MKMIKRRNERSVTRKNNKKRILRNHSKCRAQIQYVHWKTTCRSNSCLLTLIRVRMRALLITKLVVTILFTLARYLLIAM